MAQAIRKFASHMKKRSSGGSAVLGPPPTAPTELEALYKMPTGSVPGTDGEASAPDLPQEPPSPHVPRYSDEKLPPAPPQTPVVYAYLPPQVPTAVGASYDPYYHDKLIQSSPVVPESRKSPTLPNASSSTDAMMLAVYHADLEAVQAHLAAGYRLHTRNRYGESVMHLAASALTGDVGKLIGELHKGGCHVNDRDHLQRTPIHVAALVGNGPALKKLCLLDADPKAVDVQGRSPLHVAVANGHRQCVMTLLYNDADANAQDNDGTTPLMVAARQGHTSIAKLLLSYGANPGLYNHAGCIAVDIAREFGQADVAAVLSAPEVYSSAAEDPVVTSPVADTPASPFIADEERRDPMRFTAELGEGDEESGGAGLGFAEDVGLQGQGQWEQGERLASPSAVAEGQIWARQHIYFNFEGHV